MCGIAGIWNRRGRPVGREALERFTRSLAHRGPDGEGFHYEDGAGLGLGHRRLAILDLSPAGHQPMAFADGRYWITFNGEIYNFVELRRELETHGYRFHSRSDTEVVLAAYDRWGSDCQEKFNGMWAFAIWDRRERSLFLSRDRWGVKPLLYAATPECFAFASELKAFLHLEGFHARENSMALGSLLEDVFSLEASEECLLQDVKRLPAGHCMRVDAQGERITRWWNTLDHLVPVPSTLKRQAEQFRALFFDSCRLRLRSDVPLATCLSGGLDSSSVLCALGALHREMPAAAPGEGVPADWLRAFAITFPQTHMDERHYAEAAIRHAGAQGVFRTIAPEEEFDALRQVVYAHEDVFFTNPLPYWTVYRELRRSGVVVSLDGHGSDEMLAGYPYFARSWLESNGSLFRTPRRTLDVVSTLHGLDPRVSRLRTALESDPFLRPTARAALGWADRARGRSTADGAGKAGPREPWLRVTPPPEARGDPEEVEAAGALGPINALLYRSFHRTALPTELRTFDRCSMAHGVEARMPFLDWRLVCFVFSLPEESKIGGGFTKRVLREAMGETLPEMIRTRRPKIGFNSPLVTWFGGPLKEWVWQQVNDPDFLGSDVWDGKAVRAFVAERRAAVAWQGKDTQRVWRFLHAHLWRQVFLGRKTDLEGR